jgi:citrate synthase
MDTTGPDYLTSNQAVNALGIKPTTLYAYVSRGLLRSVKDPNGKKRLYRRADIERLRLQAQARTSHGAAAAGAMHYGAPIMSSEITELTPDGPRYRGLLGVDAAERLTFEDVARVRSFNS